MAINVTSFEVLSQPLVPGVANVPYVTQGTFLQLTNIGPNAAAVQVGYTATPAFVASRGDVILTANYIDGTGNVTMVPASSFLRAPVGFGSVTIPIGSTFIFGVQYIINPTTNTHMLGTTPQDGLGTRGLVTLAANVTNAKFAALATIRQVFNNFDSSGSLMDVSESAYSVPIIGGPVISL